MTTCGKCGAENVAGDAFCGSCGAFLEFAAEEAAEEAAATPAAPETAASAPAEPPTVATPAPPTPAGGEGATASTDGEPAPVVGGPICGVCGRANPFGRTFCVSCGERLEGGAARTAAPTAPSPGGGAPGAAGPTRPAWDFPTAPIPAARPMATPAPPSPEGRGGSRLPLLAGLVVVLVLVGGAAAFVVSGGLGGGSADATSSPAPSGAAVATPEATPATAEPAATPEATPTAVPATAAPATVPPGASVGLVVTSAKASSRLAASSDAKYLHDGSPVSAWLSKAKALEGAWIDVAFDAAAVTRIQLWGGWQRDEPRYYGNHRPHNVTVSFDGGVPVPLELNDVLGAQRVDIPRELGVVGATRLRITIIDTYPSKKTAAKGSPSASVAVSEIRLFGVPVTP